ncbi:MAG: sulfite exporter TauE/SafE family protein [Pseudomonadota bacterium]
MPFAAALPLGLLPISLLLGSGVIVGTTLGLIGGGGSVLAVPLLVYLVGIPPHVAIGSSAVAVAANAAWGLIAHARQGTVKWRCGMVFGSAGVAGAFAGAAFGKQLGGTELLAAFGAVMVAIGLFMLFVGPETNDDDIRLTRKTASNLLPRLLLIGGGVGLMSGFFGIGGGFLIVPGLILATGMRLQNAIGTSLFAVTAFGVATSLSYGASGLVDWRVAGLVIAGGLVGTMLGTRANNWLGQYKRGLSSVFAVVVIVTGVYIIGTGLAALLAAP